MKEQTALAKQNSADDGLDLEQLKARIRADAEERKRTSVNFSPVYLNEIPQTSYAQIPNSLPELKLQPALERRERYKLSDLLGFHDEAFVRNAYKVILKREPDDAGFAEYLGNLRSGRYSKIDIIRSLRFSPEGQKANVSLEGLSWFVNLRKLYRVPVAGYLLQLVVAIFRLPVLIANHRRLESHTAAQLDRVAGHVNEAVAQLAETESRHYENNRRLFLTNQGQLEALRNALRLQIESLAQEHTTFKTEALGRIRQQMDVQERHAAELQGLKAQLEKKIDNVIERLQGLKMEIGQQDNRLTRFFEKPPEVSSIRAEPATTQVQLASSEQDHLLDSLYYSLENVLRGTPEEIKNQVKVYLPVLSKAGITSDILDVGCGRGELLEVLREAGLKARGVDNNRILIQRCQSLSLDVTESEALTYLRSLPDESLNAVTALHFAEHLPFEILVQFLDEAGRTLKPGGLIILETPNPENLLVGSCNFYLDPTHRNPIPIPTMELLVTARGFSQPEVMRLHPVASAPIEVKDQLTSHLNHYLYGPMNYAVVAHKPGQTESSADA